MNERILYHRSRAATANPDAVPTPLAAERRVLLAVATVLALVTPLLADGVWTAGRVVEPGRDGAFRIGGGVTLEMEGMVEETERRFYDVTDQSFKQDDAERFDLNDFGMDDGYATVVLALEKNWKYFTFQWETAFSQPDANGVARRNYYIGVGDDVEFEGRTYDNMLIPEGTPFSLEMTTGTLQLRGLITPFTFTPIEGVAFTPWIDLGLFLFGGYYELDAGASTGVTQYQEPPEDFVIGGQAEGTVGLGVPEYGFGGQLRIGAPDRVNLLLEGGMTWLDFDGDTGYFTSSRHREKDVKIDHENARARLALEFPLSSGRAVTLGAQYQVIESDAMITAKDATVEETIERRERFDKHVDFKMAVLTGSVGVTF